MGVYSKIIKQAYEISKEYKFLWIFGLFLSLFLFYYLAQAIISFPSGAVIYLNILATLIVFMFYVRISTALIIGIKAILDKQQTSFGKAYRSAALFFGRIFLVMFCILSGLVVLATILIIPIIGSFEGHLAFAAVTLLVSGVLIFLPIFVTGLIVSILASMFIVVYDLTVGESVRKSWEMFSKYWYSLVGLFGLLLIYSLPALFLVGFMIGFRGGSIFTIISGIAFLLYNSAFIVFWHAAWLLVFMDLIKPQKLAEDVSAVAPEVAN